MVWLRRAIECVDDGGRMPFPFGMGVVTILPMVDGVAYEEILVRANLADRECLTCQPTHASSPGSTP